MDYRSAVELKKEAARVNRSIGSARRQLAHWTEQVKALTNTSSSYIDPGAVSNAEHKLRYWEEELPKREQHLAQLQEEAVKAGWC